MLAQGREQGREQALAQAVIDLYEARFGEAAVDLRARVDATRDPAVLRRWLTAVGTGTADDAARAIGTTPT